MNRTCTTCKYEPIELHNISCTVIQDILKQNDTFEYRNGCIMPKIPIDQKLLITDCNLWEAKDD